MQPDELSTGDAASSFGHGPSGPLDLRGQSAYEGWLVIDAGDARWPTLPLR